VRNKIIAAFDFDGTMTYCDTLIPFFCYAFGYIKTYWKLLTLFPKLMRFPLGSASRKDTKEILFKAFLEGMPRNTLQKLANGFAKSRLTKLLKASAYKRLEWHQNQGHLCVLVSANVDLILEPWAKIAGFDSIVASKLEISENQLITGRLQGIACWGEEKVSRLIDLFGEKTHYQLHAYGDSQGDRALLGWADFPNYRIFH
jgi:HAD superfamily hydrolase (TIGR01490 family)